MNLFDPQREFLANGRRTWQRGQIAIPEIQIFPLENLNIRLSIMLPVKEGIFTSKRFEKEITQAELFPALNAFVTDPESWAETFFPPDLPNLQPELRSTPKPKSLNTKPPVIKSSPAKSINELDF